LGLISYTFYLYHEAVLLKAGQYFHSRMPIALAAFSVTILISVLSWHLFEAPILGRSAKTLAAGSPSNPGASGPILWPIARSEQSKIVVATSPLYERHLN
jgi:peptidoglycan/LPS O-acetylase OafA/YrhL